MFGYVVATIVRYNYKSVMHGCKQSAKKDI